MNSKISLGQYIPKDTIIDKLDPRVKISSVFIYMIGIFLVPSLYMYIPVVAFLGIIIYLADLNLFDMLKSLKSLAFIVIFTALLNLFMTPGREIFSIWKLTITDQGLERAIFMSIRIVLLVIGTSILTLTTSPIMLTDGLESLLSPLKVVKFPAHEMAMMISIALRFIPTLFDEADKIRKAQMARGADFETGNLIQKAKNMIPLLVPLFLNSFRRADELAIAMVSRAYRGSEGRTRLNPLKMKNRDWIALFIVIGFFTLIFLSRYFI